MNQRRLRGEFQGFTFRKTNDKETRFFGNQVNVSSVEKIQNLKRPSLKINETRKTSDDSDPMDSP